jgi:hypothetical protein
VEKGESQRDNEQKVKECARWGESKCILFCLQNKATHTDKTARRQCELLPRNSGFQTPLIFMYKMKWCVLHLPC